MFDKEVIKNVVPGADTEIKLNVSITSYHSFSEEEEKKPNQNHFNVG